MYHYSPLSENKNVYIGYFHSKPFRLVQAKPEESEAKKKGRYTN